MLTVGQLKELLKDVPDDTKVAIYLEARGGRGYDVYTGKYITCVETAPYDGNGVIEEYIEQTGGALVLSDWKI
jgi:hypothetical protein